MLSGQGGVAPPVDFQTVAITTTRVIAAQRLNVEALSLKGTASHRRVIRCRFVFSGKNGELTPDFSTDTGFLHTGFLRISKNGELTPDFYRIFLLAAEAITDWAGSAQAFQIAFGTIVIWELSKNNLAKSIE